jgi:hypothetical protein
LIIKKRDPPSIKIIEINLTTTISNCKTFVFAIDLKLNAAPDIKNKMSQK